MDRRGCGATNWSLSFLISLTDGRRVRKHMEPHFQGVTLSTNPQPVKLIVSEQMEVFDKIIAA